MVATWIGCSRPAPASIAYIVIAGVFTIMLTVSAAQTVTVLSGGWLLGTRAPRTTGLWINTSPHL